MPQGTLPSAAHRPRHKSGAQPPYTTPCSSGTQPHEGTSRGHHALLMSVTNLGVTCGPSQGTRAMRAGAATVQPPLTAQQPMARATQPSSLPQEQQQLRETPPNTAPSAQLWVGWFSGSHALVAGLHPLQVRKAGPELTRALRSPACTTCYTRGIRKLAAVFKNKCRII